MMLNALFVIAAMSLVALQDAKPPLPELKPYPDSIQLCTGHVTGAPQPDGKPGMHITWTAYHTADSQETVAAHYTKTLGAGNHKREKDSDVWRFPQDKPVHVLDVQPASPKPPLSECKAPPSTARTVMVISYAARP